MTPLLATPVGGDEVMFPDGTTGTIKRYVRSRVVRYREGEVPGVTAHIVEMAKPCPQEYVTVVTRLDNGYWQAMDPVTTVSRDAAPAAAVLPSQPRWRAAVPGTWREVERRAFLLGMLVGVAVALAFGGIAIIIVSGSY